MKHNQDGVINPLLLPLILAVFFLVGAIGFGGWAYSSRQDYKTNTDQKIADAVVIAKQQESTAKDKQFAEAEKQPLKPYNGPADFGGIVIMYPKTWSSYVVSADGGTALDGYFHPGTVPGVNNQSSTFALRMQLVDTNYSDVVRSYSDSSRKLTFTPYSLPKVPKSIGVRATGQLTQNRTGQIIILPLRDKTLQIWTEGDQFTADFENNILPNITFVP